MNKERRKRLSEANGFLEKALYLIDEIIKAMSGGENETTCQY